MNQHRPPEIEISYCACGAGTLINPAALAHDDIRIAIYENLDRNSDHHAATCDHDQIDWRMNRWNIR